MADVIKTLTNIRSLRVLARELTLEQLESILEKIQFVTEEKRTEIAEIERQKEQRKERLMKYKELLKQDGITADELAEILSSNVNKKQIQRPAKYQYLDKNGKMKTWTGQGRTPYIIQEALNAGKSLSEFEI
ncbi:H-NS family nucleoid-associated regulatory protein [Seminibacterium arietis]|uniref:DNA-binding protein n=1 Tax=Seminibacterium arietis TaxID=1173502 RepID=A0ABW3IA19_9PAST